MARIVLEVDTSAWSRAAEGLLRGTEDMRPLLTALGMMLMRSVDKQFRAQGSRFGEGWTPLKPKTKYRRRKSGLGAQILLDRGTLQKSVTQQGAPGNIYKLEPLSLTLGSNLRYANIHQFGGTITQGARSNLNPTRWANVGGQMLFQGADDKVRVASKLDGTPIRKKFKTAKEMRLSFRERKITIPARPYLPRQIIDEDRDLIAKALAHYLTRRLEEGS